MWFIIIIAALLGPIALTYVCALFVYFDCFHLFYTYGGGCEGSLVDQTNNRL